LVAQGFSAGDVAVTVSGRAGSQDVGGPYAYTTTAAPITGSAFSGAVSVKADLTITPALLTISTFATPASITQGDAAPTYNIAATGLAAGDSTAALFGLLVAGSTYDAAANNAPGTYAVTLNQTTLTAANYTVRVVNGEFEVVALPVIPVVPAAPAPAAPAAPAPAAPAPVALAAAPVPDDPTPSAPAPSGDRAISTPESPLTVVDGSWALLNLILAVVAAICAFALIISLATGKRRSNEQTGQSDQENKKNGHLWRVLGIVFGVASPVVFALTENIMLKMIIVDQWTILMAVITVLQVTTMIVLRKVRHSRNEVQKAQA
ncbi:MAG: hypothetical protein LBU48_05325, partial [Coriobacteriales bacterium]|nr:hypothetical protein [Coriobacteriales bacterium]